MKTHYTLFAAVLIICTLMIPVSATAGEPLDYYFYGCLNGAVGMPSYDCNAINNSLTAGNYPALPKKQYYLFEISSQLRGGFLQTFDSKDGSSYSTVGISFTTSLDEKKSELWQNGTYLGNSMITGNSLNFFTGFNINIFETLSLHPYLILGVNNAELVLSRRSNSVQSIGEALNDTVNLKELNMNGFTIGAGLSLQYKIITNEEIRDTIYKFDSCSCFSKYNLINKNYLTIGVDASYNFFSSEHWYYGTGKIRDLDWDFPKGFILKIRIGFEMFTAFRKLE